MASSLTYRSDEAVLREMAQAEPARVQPSPAARGLFRLAQLGAFVSALADICRVALSGDNSTLSFFITGLSFAALLPVALAIHELLRTRLSGNHARCWRSHLLALRDPRRVGGTGNHLHETGDSY